MRKEWVFGVIALCLSMPQMALPAAKEDVFTALKSAKALNQKLDYSKPDSIIALYDQEKVLAPEIATRIVRLRTELESKIGAVDPAHPLKPSFEERLNKRNRKKLGI